MAKKSLKQRKQLKHPSHSSRRQTAKKGLSSSSAPINNIITHTYKISTERERERSSRRNGDEYFITFYYRSSSSPVIIITGTSEYF